MSVNVSILSVYLVLRSILIWMVTFAHTNIQITSIYSSEKKLIVHTNIDMKQQPMTFVVCSSCCDPGTVLSYISETIQLEGHKTTAQI